MDGQALQFTVTVRNKPACSKVTITIFLANHIFVKKTSKKFVC